MKSLRLFIAAGLLAGSGATLFFALGGNQHRHRPFITDLRCAFGCPPEQTFLPY